MSRSYNYQSLCGCWYPVQINNDHYRFVERRYLPQIQLSSSTDILTVTSRTTLKQTFINPEDKHLDEVHYTFPLYDGVAVVQFTCTIGTKTVVGVVKEKQQAKVEYQEALARGETAGLLQQLPEASDAFTTSIGNIPPKEKVFVEIVYIGELKHDAETDGSRFTIPTTIAPRYGSVSGETADTLNHVNATNKGGISICVNVTLEEGSMVRGLQSPSHPIAVTMGRTADADENQFDNKNASATLTLGSTELEKDFIVVVLAKGVDTPRALLETHPSLPNQRAIMTTLVPKFNIPNICPEIVFVLDRSGSMANKITTVVAAMRVFLKSLPIGVKFNICSFGSRHSFLFNKSRTYDQSSLTEAQKHLETFDANFGGTEMLPPIKETVKNRYSDLPLEVMLLTDGEIWNQEELFTFVNDTKNARFFTLGIGDGASSALVEGIARAGNGFAQFVGANEKMDRRVVRMLRAALTPHISDYTLTVTYSEDPISAEEDFEMIEPVKSEKTVFTNLEKTSDRKTISLFDAEATEKPSSPPTGRHDHLPNMTAPIVLQAPHRIAALYPSSRTTVYLILGPGAPETVPKLVTLRATSDHGPLEVDLPIQNAGIGERIHQLAAKKAIHELEQGRGWITEARDAEHRLIREVHEGKWDLIVEREAVRLGVQFQVAGKWCSFVAIEKNGRIRTGAPVPSAELASSYADAGVSGKDRDMSKAGSFASVASYAEPLSFPHLRSSQMRQLSKLSHAPASTGGLFGAASTGFGASIPSQSAGISAIPRAALLPLVAGQKADCRFTDRARDRMPRVDAGARDTSADGKGVDEANAVDIDAISALSDKDKMHKVIAPQEFDGSWNASDELFALLGATQSQANGPSRSADDMVNATALVVAWLKKRAASEEDVWEMVVEKATGWLEGKLGSDEASMVVDEAAKVF